MIRRTLLACLLLFIASCPGPGGTVDPYLTAHSVINQAQTALALADGIFNQWLLGQTDPVKAKKAQQDYLKIRTAVANGLVVAHNAVDVAKQTKQDPDVAKLLQQANVAWTNLVRLVSDLLGAGDVAVSVELPDVPASQPVGTVGVTKSAVKIAKSPVSYLPTTLIPK